MERYDQAAVGYIFDAFRNKFALRQEVCPRLLLLPLDKMLVHCRVTPSSMSLAPTRWRKIPCLRKQRDGRGLNPGLPDPEFKVLTAWPHTPTQITRKNVNEN